MRRYLNPFALLLTVLVLACYAYAALRLTSGRVVPLLVLAVPFSLIWLIPIVYWIGDRVEQSRADYALHVASYLSMGWLSFLFIFLLGRDLLLLIAMSLGETAIAEVLSAQGNVLIFGLSGAALLMGAVRARRGPAVHEMDLPIEGLAHDLDGFRIVHISDLHVGPTIRRAYVKRVVSLTQQLAPDLVALTGDMVDGTVGALAAHVAPLADLPGTGTSFLALGNHDYYSGAAIWTEHFEKLGIRVLLNSHAILTKGPAQVLVAGVLDPAAKLSDPALQPDPYRALAFGESTSSNTTPSVRILLAHNPKIAKDAEEAGFDLQLSGHTHAGQFIPWTLVVRLVHKPHFAGLSRQGRMWVYVSAGTGTWGPPIRIGTEPELTLIRLRRSWVPSGTTRASS